MGVVSLTFFNLCFLHFPTPTAKSRGWMPLAFSRDVVVGKTKRVEIFGGNAVDADTSALVLWRSSCGDIFARADVCPHLGSRLSGSTSVVLDNGCIRCPYHGLQVGASAPDAEARHMHGTAVDANGIVWWCSDVARAGESPVECTDLTECMDRKDVTVSQWSMQVNASFSDCFRNSMDLHHAGWLHASSFGNAVRDPVDICTTTWGQRGAMRVTFQYVSNPSFQDITGATTSNYHEFRAPSTTWNKVTSEDGTKFVMIHIAIRPVRETTMKWYVTSVSNYIPVAIPSPVRTALLERVTRRVAQLEDRGQLHMMVSKNAKNVHAGLVELPLDKVYSEWMEVCSEYD